jgi:nucleoside-diphosphate-sugar epimerase
VSTGAYEGAPVLVTGGASFIGSHLVDRLVELGARVRVADDLSSGTLGNLARSIARVEFCEGDLRDRTYTRDVLDGQRAVFHLAAAHGGRGFIDTHPADCAGNMVLDGIVIDEAHTAGVENFCFASSACVYPVGLQNGVEFTLLREEWADPFVEHAANADGEYGWAKLMAELMLRAYWKQHGMKSVACRLFTAYGERENETHAIIAFIAKAFARTDPFDIWGDGTQDRNFTYVGDIVEGMLRAAIRVEDATPVNIGTEQHISVRQVVELVCRIMEWRPREFVFDTSKPVGVLSRAADLTRTRARLDWEPTTSLEDGLRRTIRWYCDEHDQDTVRKDLERLLLER